jgi:hypothetical protein
VDKLAQVREINGLDVGVYGIFIYARWFLQKDRCDPRPFRVWIGPT